MVLNFLSLSASTSHCLTYLRTSARLLVAPYTSCIGIDCHLQGQPVGILCHLQGRQPAHRLGGSPGITVAAKPEHPSGSVPSARRQHRGASISMGDGRGLPGACFKLAGVRRNHRVDKNGGIRKEAKNDTFCAHHLICPSMPLTLPTPATMGVCE